MEMQHLVQLTLSGPILVGSMAIVIVRLLLYLHLPLQFGLEMLVYQDSVQLILPVSDIAILSLLYIMAIFNDFYILIILISSV